MPVLIFAAICLAVAVVSISWLVFWIRVREMESLMAEEGTDFSAIPLSLVFEPHYAILWDRKFRL